MLMTVDDDLLFGMIALSQGYCTRAQIDHCLRMQSTVASDAAVGELLLTRRFITSPQHDKVLTIQKHNLHVRALHTVTGKEAGGFGMIAVREGVLTSDEVKDCLCEQAKEGEKRSLGAIAVAQGYLTAAQVKCHLGKLRKALMSCPICRFSFTLLPLSKGQHVDCPRCKVSLREGKKHTESIMAVVEITTRIPGAVQGELAEVTRPLRRAQRVTPVPSLPLTSSATPFAIVRTVGRSIEGIRARKPRRSF